MQSLQDQSVVFPPLWQATRVLWSARMADDMESWKKCVWHYASDHEEFVATSPSLGCTPLSATDKARTFNRAVVHDLLLPKISAGEPASESLRVHCEAILSIAEALPGATEPVLSTTITEAGMIAEGLLALLSPRAEESDGFLEQIDALFAGGAEPDDTKTLIQKGLQQNQFYRSLERDLRKTAVGCKTLLPDIAQQMEKLKDKKSMEAGLESVARQIGLWAESLPASRLAPVWDACEEACKSLLGEDATTDSTDFLLRVCGQFKDLPGPHREWCETAMQAAKFVKKTLICKARSDEVQKVFDTFLMQDRLRL